MAVDVLYCPKDQTVRAGPETKSLVFKWSGYDTGSRERKNLIFRRSFGQTVMRDKQGDEKS